MLTTISERAYNINSMNEYNPYEPSLNPVITLTRLEERVARTGSTNRDVFESVVDVFATRGGEGWMNSDESRLILDGGHELLVGYDAPTADVPGGSAWTDRYDTNTTKFSENYYFQDRGGEVVSALYDGDKDEEVPLDLEPATLDLLVRDFA